MRKGEFDKAIADETETINIEHDNQPAYAARGSRMPKNAKTTVPSTIIPKPSASARGYGRSFRRAIAWKADGNLKQAIDDLTEALRIDPKYVTAIIYRGTYSELNNDLDGAINDFTDALAIDPDNGDAHARRAHDR